MATSVELRQRRASLWEEAKSLHNLAEKEKRQLTAEEKEQWDNLNKEIDSLKETIDRMERMAQIDVEMEETPDPVVKKTTRKDESFGIDPEDENQSIIPASKEYKKAFGSYLRYGFGGMRPEQRAVLQPYFGGNVNVRALGTLTDAVGGATVAEEFYRKLVEALVAFGGMRQANTTKFTTTTGADMPIPMVDDTYNEGAILTEGTNVDTGGVDPTFDSKTLGSYLYTSKLVRISVQLLQDSAFNLESWLATALGRRLGRITNQHFTTGNGTTQPEGILTAAPAGIIDVDIDLDYADLIALEHSVDPAYRSNGAQWMFHDTTLALLKQLKTTEDSRAIWLPGLAVSAPDTILGYPYIINQAMPQAECEAKAILFGDFSYYFIRDVQDIRVLRLEERFAEYLQVGFLAFLRTDGLLATPSDIEDGSEAGGNDVAPVKYLQFAAEST